MLHREDNDIRDDLHKCYYLSKPIIRALGSSLVKTLNKFNHNMINMLEQHRQHFYRLTKDMIINQTKWVYENYNLFPNEKYFNRRILNITLPCYSIDVNFVNIETFSKDLTKTLVGCNIIEGAGANYKTVIPIDVDEKDTKWLDHDIDEYYELVNMVACLRTKEFIYQILNMIKQNTSRYHDILNIVRKMSTKQPIVTQEDLDPMKNYFIFSNLSGIANSFCKPSNFLHSIDTEDVLATFLKEPRAWDGDKITNNLKLVFNNLDSKIEKYFNDTIDKIQVVEKYKLVTKIDPKLSVSSEYDETLGTHPYLKKIKHWSVIPDEDLKSIENIIVNISNYKGSKIDKGLLQSYVGYLNRLIEILEYYKLNYDNQIWEHIGCKNDVLSNDPITKPKAMLFGQI